MGTYQDLVAEQHHQDQMVREQEQRDAAAYINRWALREGWSDEDRAEVLGALGLDTSPLPG
jgi:hypothetical protein